MEFITDVTAHADMIQQSIAQYGHSAEHNYYCYLYTLEPGEEGVFVSFPPISSHADGSLFSHPDESSERSSCESSDESLHSRMASYGILAKREKNGAVWRVFSEVLAPKDAQLPCLKAFLDHVFSAGAQKVWVEFTTDFRKQLLRAYGAQYKINRPAYSLEWPVFDMHTWTGEKMEGKEWKDMRYYWNRFFKTYAVEWKCAQDVDADAMHALVKKWKSQRTTGDRTSDHYFHHAIDAGFKGYQTRIMVIDGKPAALTAGFKIPGSNAYYSSMGIYDRDFERIGEIANMDDLLELKKQGFDTVDFGGGEKTLTAFKSKFKPTSSYKTHIFSIVPRKNGVRTS